MAEIVVGVLGIQGAYEKHAKAIEISGGRSEIIKYREQLEHIDGLILPGGESTTMTKLMGFRIGYEDLLAFAKKKPVFGTCAGLILLGKGINDPRIKQFKIFDADISRNAYGSQKDSFVDNIDLSFDPDKPYHAVFIRAPKIERCGDGVKVLALSDGKPVLVESGSYLGATFHPELTDDPRIHSYFIRKIKEAKNGKTNAST